GQGNPADSQQIVDRKMEADTEHQQHHADFGELIRKLNIGDKPGCGWANDNAGNEVTYQGGQLYPGGDKTHNQRQSQGGSDRGDQSNVMRHSSCLLSW